MVDLSLTDSFLTHHCVLILGWLLILAATYTFLRGDGQIALVARTRDGRDRGPDRG